MGGSGLVQSGRGGMVPNVRVAVPGELMLSVPRIPVARTVSRAVWDSGCVNA